MRAWRENEKLNRTNRKICMTVADEFDDNFDDDYFEEEEEETQEKAERKTTFAEQLEQRRKKLKNDRVEAFLDSIRSWLRYTDYKKFLAHMQNRVMGQPELRLICANVYNYLTAVSEGRRPNNNMLLAAPSGCGKTETYRALRNYFNEFLPLLPVAIFDMTSMTEEGFKGKDTAALLSVFKDKEYTKGIGLIFMDELDKKIMPSYTSSGMNVNAAVQNQLLLTIEGIEKDGVDTNNTMFIGMGAFNSCREKKMEKKASVGFLQQDNEGKTAKHYDPITREDMIELGASYEFLGRFTSIVNYYQLDDVVVEQLLQKTTKRVADRLGVTILLSSSMRTLLHQKANGVYGCRMLENIIQDAAMLGYCSILENNMDINSCQLLLEGERKVKLRRQRVR